MQIVDKENVIEIIKCIGIFLVTLIGTAVFVLLLVHIPILLYTFCGLVTLAICCGSVWIIYESRRW